jgi:hypothetical protein
MKDSVLVERGSSSALFVFSTTKEGYQLLLGSNGSAVVIRDAVRALRERMETDWIYVDSILNAGGCVLPDLFQAPISVDDPVIKEHPEEFFGGTNYPGLVVAPLSAIKLGGSVKTILVLRDHHPRVYRDDVTRSLKALMEYGIVWTGSAEGVATRIGVSSDVGRLIVGGKEMHLSISRG